MREIRLYGSVRGVPGNRHSYRDPPNLCNEALCVFPVLSLLPLRRTGLRARHLRRAGRARRRQDREWRPRPALQYCVPPCELSSLFFVPWVTEAIGTSEYHDAPF